MSDDAKPIAPSSVSTSCTCVQAPQFVCCVHPERGKTNSPMTDLYFDAFDEATAYIGAVAEVRGRYPEDVFPPDGDSPDATAARFARTLCDEITRIAKKDHLEIMRSRRGL
jgi:hypothetical protein